MKIRNAIVVILKLIACYAYDGWRFARSAHLFGPFKNRACARAHLLRLAHSLEKGMALPAPRHGFGKNVTGVLLDDLERYSNEFSPDDTSCSVLGIIEATLEYHRKRDVEWPEYARRVAQLRSQHEGVVASNDQAVGTVQITRSELEKALPRDPEAFFNLRRSVRQFCKEPITQEEIRRAVFMAQRSPSVCNRQGAKVYVYTEPADRARVLSFQDGNEGFGDRASAVFVVTSDMSMFYKNGERNQAFVDGGLFAMSLVFALHAMCFGTCMLNWSKGPQEDLRLRKALKISDCEVVVTLLVAGRLLPEFSVAASPRRSLDEVLILGVT